MKNCSILNFCLISSILLISFSCQTKIKVEDKGKMEYPGEWLYNQRAYPNNYINKEAYSQAIVQSKQILSNRLPNVDGDWEFIGPLNTGGRVTDVAISPVNDDHIYLAAASGGIFRSYNRGVTWTPIFDEISKPSIGDIAIAPSNSQIIYAGTGEANASGGSGTFFGDGVYKSIDAGDTWTNVGLHQSDHIGRIIVDPTNPDRVFVAATGQLYGKNDERGIYRTEDGGESWEQVLFVTDSTAAIDVAMNVVNTNIIYAAMWERTRKPWERDFGGVTSAIHRSLDGGTTWTQLGAVNGLPESDEQTGRIGIAVSESDPSTVYARFTTDENTNEFDGLYKSTNNGNTWTLVTAPSVLSFIDAYFGWYFGNVRVNPTNSSEVYILGLEIARSLNSGSSWQILGGMHVDHHALEFSRNNPNFMVAGNDGGAYTSEDGGNSWTKFENLPFTQFYNIEVDFTQPERLYGGTQDNNTIRTLTGGTNDWNSIWGGDGFHVNVDPVNNNFIYVEAQYGFLGRSTNGGDVFTVAMNGIDNSDRMNWNTPVIISPFNHEILYYGSHRLYTSNKADFWSIISPDLTGGQHPNGSLSFGTLTAIAASYNNLEVIYTGSDDGNVNVTFDGGETWTNVSAGLPNQHITSIAMVPNNDLIAYVTFSGFKYLDYTAHVFKTIDGGQTWMDISSNLPNIPVNDIITYPEQNLLFVATDLNVWYSSDDGANWTILGSTLPFNVVMDLKLHKPTQTLYAGTYGRGMYSYKLTSILNTHENELPENSVQIFPNPATTEFTISQNLNTDGNIQLYDSSGKLLGDLFNGNFGSNQYIKVKTEGLSSGVYFVKLNSGKQSLTKKIVIKK